MDNDQIKHMVNRFLMWKLPEHFRPDCGIIYTPIRIADGRLLEPSGTNLLDATQAEAMVRHMIEGLPAARPASGEREGETPEDRAEQFIQAAVDRAPEPLRRLGEWLANVLDEDEWKTAERMLLGATTAAELVKVEVQRDAADLAIQRIGMALGSADEWSDQANMIGDVTSRAEAAQARIAELEAEIARLTRDDKAIQEEYAFCRKRLLIVADEKIAAEAALEKAREVIRELANTADDIGVKYFDTDDMAAEAVAMQEATLAARAFLASQKEG